MLSCGSISSIVDLLKVNILQLTAGEEPWLCRSRSSRLGQETSKTPGSFAGVRYVFMNIAFWRLLFHRSLKAMIR